MIGLIKVEITDELGATWAYLCVFCALQTPACLSEISSARAEIRAEVETRPSPSSLQKNKTPRIEPSS
jgi:hypothetical protein